MATIQWKSNNKSSTKKISNIFCIGRNYVDHVEELNNELPTEPLVFFKPTSSMTNESTPITLPTYSNNVHFEGELLLYIGQDANKIDESKAHSVISAVGIGLDLTARDIQEIEKEKGYPWSRSKGFPQAAAVSTFIDVTDLSDLTNAYYYLDLNGERAQTGNTQLMIFPIPKIIAYLSEQFGLMEGDIIFTGTPAGVAQVNSGDLIEMGLETNSTPLTAQFIFA